MNLRDGQSQTMNAAICFLSISHRCIHYLFIGKFLPRNASRIAAEMTVSR
jgi:hypothetical protein